MAAHSPMGDKQTNQKFLVPVSSRCIHYSRWPPQQLPVAPISESRCRRLLQSRVLPAPSHVECPCIIMSSASAPGRQAMRGWRAVVAPSWRRQGTWHTSRDRRRRLGGRSRTTSARLVSCPARSSTSPSPPRWRSPISSASSLARCSPAWANSGPVLLRSSRLPPAKSRRGSS